MAHEHNVYDTDPHFIIDPVTRVITNQSSTKTMIIQNDHNSERFSFKMPRMVEEHDMLKCNRVQVHYINFGSNTRYVGVYEVTDVHQCPDDENLIQCSWLISRNATQLVGTLNFVLRFACVNGDDTDYVWNTAVHSGIAVSTGIDNSGEIVEQYADVLESWYAELVAAGTTSLRSISEAKTSAIEDLDAHKAMVLEHIGDAGGIVTSKTEPDNEHVSAWVKDSEGEEMVRLVEERDLNALHEKLAPVNTLEGYDTDKAPSVQAVNEGLAEKAEVQKFTSGKNRMYCARPNNPNSYYELDSKPWMNCIPVYTNVESNITPNTSKYGQATIVVASPKHPYQSANMKYVDDTAAAIRAELGRFVKTIEVGADYYRRYNIPTGALPFFYIGSTEFEYSIDGGGYETVTGNFTQIEFFAEDGYTSLGAQRVTPGSFYNIPEGAFWIGTNAASVAEEGGWDIMYLELNAAILFQVKGSV